jgi:hypothetical protein
MISCSCDASGEQLDGCDEQPSGGGCDRLFEVFGEASVSAEPCEGSFYNPAAGENLKALGDIGPLDDLDGAFADGDRQMVDILTAVLSDGLTAVEAACAEALREGVHSADVVLNILARQREPPAPLTILTPDALRLRHEPLADCARCDSLRRSA